MLEQYGITVERTTVGGVAWRLTGIEKLPAHENMGRHAVYVNAFNTDGTRAKNVYAQAIQAFASSESPVVAPLDKPDSPYEQGHGNIPMYREGTYTVFVREGLMASDKVHGLHTRHPDENEGNTWGHHSFRLTFKRSRADTSPPPTEPPPVTTEQRLSEVERQLAALIANYAKLVQHLRGTP